MFFETTIMEKTADLLKMVQKTIVDTLHKEGKSQRVITERGGCSRSAVSKHIKCKVDWKDEIGLEKVHKQQGLSQGVNWSWSQCIKSQHFSTCPQYQNHFQVVCWPWYYCAWLESQHAWPELHMESMGYFQEKDSRSNNTDELPHLTDAGVCAIWAPNKYWVHKWTYFKELELFCFHICIHTHTSEKNIK